MAKILKLKVGIFLAIASLFLITSCSSNKTLKDGTYTMEVKSVENKTISGLLGKLSETGSPGDGDRIEEKPEGTPPSGEDFSFDDSGMEKPSDGEAPPSDKKGDFPGGNGFTSDEDEKVETFTVNDDTEIVMNFMKKNQEGTLEDISEGTIIEVTVKNGVATTISIRSMNMNGYNGDFDGTPPNMDGTTENTSVSGIL